VSTLSSLSCTPVYHTTGSDESANKVVLVKPCQVLKTEWNNVEEVKGFHPFLHSLPDELGSFPKLLGVKTALELGHIQIVLEGAYKASEGTELNVNTDNHVKLAIAMLEKFLTPYQQKFGNAGPLLSPFYLPDSENKLRPSKQLVYSDGINYWGDITLDLKDTPYYHFDIKVADYKIDAPVLCNMLPEEVRPIGLSTVCKQVVLASSQEVTASEVAKKLKATLKFEDIPEGIVSFINRFVSKQENEIDLKQAVRCFLATIEIITVQALRIRIVLTEFGEEIGKKCNSTYKKGQ
jgi:hypothetical protein